MSLVYRTYDNNRNYHFEATQAINQYTLIKNDDNKIDVNSH